MHNIIIIIIIMYQDVNEKYINEKILNVRTLGK